MARLPYLEPDQVAPEYRDMLKRNTNLHKLMVNSPDMAKSFNGVGNFIRFKSKLDPRLRELAILQVGWLERSEYEFTHHVRIGKEFGVTDEDIQALFLETDGKAGSGDDKTCVSHDFLLGTDMVPSTTGSGSRFSLTAAPSVSSSLARQS